MTSILEPLITATDALWHRYGAEPPLDGLRITRTDTPSGIIRAVYQPSLCVVLQGSKMSMLGNQAFHYTSGQCLLASVNVPVTARITGASAETPYLAFSFAIDPVTVGDLLVERADALPQVQPRAALQTADIPQTLLDPLTRLLALPNHPEDMPVLAPLIQKEIAWRLLGSELSEPLRHLGLKESHTARVGRATAWIREHYNQPLRVTDLARMINMSPASFHRHFKAVTQATPVQFQKQIRLQEARRLLLTREDVAAVGFSVGYESASQFSRDYRKLFGAPPGQDRDTMRASLAS
ncbi:AraC family transcriptional regulator [Saccharospirillum salsuginis]|uniref:AraC family transcriptional regulator n=1 Tax=Saccharospirillum salsuginis TaxID=418750 RepID=A0A918KAF1_9GAMM|nr:AraC family transcriptional regulator [Saccharospirillum salsuginis]GGX54850.1 AraC family transcriptional regulator [Saccharospirillum salsuginis]